MDPVVPNQQSAIDPGPVRLAIVGEAPSMEECSWALCASGHGFAMQHWEARQIVQRSRCPLCGSAHYEPSPTPFVGPSGRLLDALLAESGLERARCFVGNCSRRPLAEAEKTLDQCKGGLARLAIDLDDFKPNCVLCLGGLALAAFHPDAHNAKISHWRGSIFEGALEGHAYKCVAALHPAAILREPQQLALLRRDVERAVGEAASPALDLPQRSIVTPTQAEHVIISLQALRLAKQLVGYDIEGTVDTGITVCSFALTPSNALSIPFKRLDWSSVWDKADEARLLTALGDVLADPALPKVCHNAQYEAFVHRWLHGHSICNVEDTMLAWHVLYPELLKDLSVVASVLTRQPYWGEPGDWTTDVDRDTYNAIDSCVTLECWQAMRSLFTPAQWSYYQHCRDLLAPVLDMMVRGIAYDSAARDQMLAQTRQEMLACQGELDELSGIARPTFEEVADAVVFKNRRDRVVDWPDIIAHAKPSFRHPLTGGY